MLSSILKSRLCTLQNHCEMVRRDCICFIIPCFESTDFVSWLPFFVKIHEGFYGRSLQKCFNLIRDFVTLKMFREKRGILLFWLISLYGNFQFWSQISYEIPPRASAFSRCSNKHFSLSYEVESSMDWSSSSTNSLSLLPVYLHLHKQAHLGS